MTKVDEALLPCPFCGGSAEIFHISGGENDGGSCVSCTRCLASGNLEFGRKENFVSNWNTRAGQAHARRADAGLLAALERMVYEATHLSPMRPNGDHDCTIKADALAQARAAISAAKGANQ